MSSDMAAKAPARKLWGGRFTGGVLFYADLLAASCLQSLDMNLTGATDPLMHQFNQSLGYDQRMFKADIRGSQAYAIALHASGILASSELKLIREGLDEVLLEWESSGFVPIDSDEDIHTANERRLAEKIGATAGKLHTGRSRNDQVATDMRLWLMEECTKLLRYLESFIQVIVGRAEKEIDVLMPGYTHLQRAQPIRWSHFLMSHATSFLSDLDRLKDLFPRIAVLPLGSGPLAGNPFNIDRELLLKELGFKSLSINSMNGVSDRDFVAEFLFWATMTMVHISRFAEDLIIYSSSEFGYITLSDAYSTGSSIMPQKKNPDSLELLRGKSGRTCGQLTGFLMTYKGLPATYNKDLQEDKEPLFDAADTLSASIQIFEGVIATLNINDQAMKAALTPEMLATDLAEYLVRKGIPFRETHHISGSAVRLAEQNKISLAQLTLEQYQSLSTHFAADVFEVFDFEKSVERKDVAGGTSKRAVQMQINQVTGRLSS